MGLGVLSEIKDRPADGPLRGDSGPPLVPAGELAPDSTAEDYGLRLNLRRSAIAHGALLLVVVIRSIVLPGSPKTYQPALRVDLVGLPDLLRQEMQNVPRAGQAAPEDSAKSAKEETAKERQEKSKEEADPDEMVLKRESKSLAEKNRARLKEFEKQTRAEESRKKRMEAALNRVKSLAKLNDLDSRSESTKPGVLIKGNQVSAGSSTSGDARESSQPRYADQVQARLQENWELPVYLSRQNLSARIEIFVDRRGMIRSFRFTKASGSPQFDEAIKRTLAASQPLPTPPAEEVASLLTRGISVGFPL